MRTLLRNGTIVTMDSVKEIKKNCDLLIQDDLIVGFAPGGSSNPKDFDISLECRGKIIIPGLVSAHSHLTGMFQRGLWDETSFEAWSRKSNAMENLLNFSPEELYTIHCAACIEFIRHGVTSVLNMFTVSPGSEMEKVQSSSNAMLNAGLRGILALSLTPSNEAGPTDPASPASLLELAQGTAEYVAGRESRLTCMLAPSAPQRCSDQFLLSCKQLADIHGLGMHTHLAEARSHAEAGRRIYGEPIVRHLERIGFLNSHLSVAHGIWLEEEEIELLREFDVKVVHNPACNMKLADGPAQVKKMLRKGLSVGLGSDSVNAGTVYSVFEQMKLAVLLPRVLWGPDQWILPAEAFEMGCLGGARAVFLDSQIGSLEEGKKADLVVLRPSTSLMPLNDLIDQLALCENGDSVESVLVDGRPIMIERSILTLETEEILGRLCSFGERIRHLRDQIN